MVVKLKRKFIPVIANHVEHIACYLCAKALFHFIYQACLNTGLAEELRDDCHCKNNQRSQREQRKKCQSRRMQRSTALGPAE